MSIMESAKRDKVAFISNELYYNDEVSKRLGGGSNKFNKHRLTNE